MAAACRCASVHDHHDDDNDDNSDDNRGVIPLLSRRICFPEGVAITGVLINAVLPYPASSVLTSTRAYPPPSGLGVDARENDVTREH